MTKREREQRGLERMDLAAESAKPNPDDGGDINRPHLLSRTGAEATRQAACSALSHLFMRDDGWLRARPDRDRTTLWLKWKFTDGRWSNHYVMVSVKVWDWDIGLQLLVDKLENVERGMYRPTFDTPYIKD